MPRRIRRRREMSDLIDRQEAIKAISEYGSVWMEYSRGMTKDEIAQRALNNAKATMIRIVKELPSAQPERTCVNCGRTANNGGWYADGRTRCPIEEHYALPKDGYCHLWEKRTVTDDDYPEGRADE